MLELPPILQGSEREQLAALRDYLVRLARNLDRDGGAANTTAGTAAASARPGTVTAGAEEARKNAGQLRSLIVKTAERLRTDLERTTRELADRIEAVDGSYFYIRYAPVQQPSAEQMSASPRDDTVYMGICNTAEETAPEDPARYEWTRVRGEDSLQLQIVSSHGSIFKNGAVATTLSARVRQGDADITDRFDASAFHWTRQSADAEADAAWNREYAGGTKSVTLSPADIQGRATFFCDLI